MINRNRYCTYVWTCTCLKTRPRRACTLVYLEWRDIQSTARSMIAEILACQLRCHLHIFVICTWVSETCPLTFQHYCNFAKLDYTHTFSVQPIEKVCKLIIEVFTSTQDLLQLTRQNHKVNHTLSLICSPWVTFRMQERC